MDKSTVVVVGAMTALFAAGPAGAQPETEVSAQAIEGQAPLAPAVDRNEATEGPQERPRRTGLVLESTLGVLGFAGNFRHVAPPAYWVHSQLGYEVTRGIMVYVDGDVAFTDTSESQEVANTYTMVLWGFGGGLRGTVHVSERVALYGQGDLGAFTADVKHDQLTVLGYRRAESINPSVGARLGIEWYQVDRHLALCLVGGGRYAQGFARVVGPTDLPLMWDAGLSLRYTF